MNKGGRQGMPLGKTPGMATYAGFTPDTGADAGEGVDAGLAKPGGIENMKGGGLTGC